MDVSVIICTRDRAAQLNEVLASFIKIKIPTGLSWELIIVDNGSTDNTPQIIETFGSTLPIRRVEQPLLGLSNARNAGAAQASGKYIVWTDDDVRVDTHWLSAYCDAFARWPDASLFGGKIFPKYEPPTPAWFSASREDIKGAFAERNFGEVPLPLSIEKGILLSGANWAIRSDIQKRYTFNPELGVAPGRRMGGEEIDVVHRLLNSGHTGWWLPDPIIHHIVPPHRQTMEFLATYNESDGELKAYLGRRDGTTALLFGVPPLLWLRLASCLAKYGVSRLFNRPSWIRHFTSYHFRLGEYKTWRGYATGKLPLPSPAPDVSV